MNRNVLPREELEKRNRMLSAENAYLKEENYRLQMLTNNLEEELSLQDKGAEEACERIGQMLSQLDIAVPKDGRDIHCLIEYTRCQLVLIYERKREERVKAVQLLEKALLKLV